MKGINSGDSFGDYLEVEENKVKMVENQFSFKKVKMPPKSKSSSNILTTKKIIKEENLSGSSSHESESSYNEVDYD